MKKLILSLVTVTMLTTSCATIISGRTQAVKIDSAPSGGNCQYTNELSDGLLTAPNSVQVKKSNNDLKINCTRQEYGAGSIKQHPSANFWVLANVFNFGVGYVYDLYTGAAWNYPEEISVPLQPTSATFHGNFMMKPASSSAVDVPQMYSPVPGTNGYPSANGAPAAAMPASPYPVPTQMPAATAAQQQQQWMQPAAATTYQQPAAASAYPAAAAPTYPATAPAAQGQWQPLQPNQSITPPGVTGQDPYDKMLPTNVR